MCLNFSVTYVGVPYIAPPLALATRGFPHSIAAPWAAPYGHPCPTALTRLLPGFPLRNDSIRPAGMGLLSCLVY